MNLHRIQYNQMGCTLPALLVSCMCLTVCGGLSRLVVIYIMPYRTVSLLLSMWALMSEFVKNSQVELKLQN